MTNEGSPGQATDSATAPSDAERLTDAGFVTQDVDATMATMVDDPFVNHVPVMTAGTGHAEVRAFYSARFIPRMSPDVETAAKVLDPSRPSNTLIEMAKRRSGQGSP